MSTQGLIAFVESGKLYATYNNNSSYPTWQLAQLIEWVQAADMQEARAGVRRLQMVCEDDAPSEQLQIALSEFSRTSSGGVTVNEGRADDWYCLIRETHGDPEAMLACGYMIDNIDFAADGTFCEWAYVLNLDSEQLEVHRGNQPGRHDSGRFAHLDSHDPHSHPVRLVATYGFDELPEEAAIQQLQDRYIHAGLKSA